MSNRAPVTYQSDSPTYRVGLVGYGMVCEVFHGPLLSSHGRFEVACALERSSNKSPARHPGITVVRRLEDLLEQDIDVVVIATPSGSHFSVAAQALAHPRPRCVVVEKPFTVTTTEAEELTGLARTHGKLLTVFHNRRFDSDFKTVRQVVASGVLGRLCEVEVHYDRFRTFFKDNWREKDVPGSGILYDLGSHLVDQALVLLGRPSAVRADIRRQREGAMADDFFDIDLRYDERPGLKVTLRAGMVVRRPGPKYAIHGTGGSFVKHGQDVQESQLKAGLVPGSPGWGEEDRDIHGVLDTVADGGMEMSGTVRSLPGSYEDFYVAVARALDGDTAEMLPVQAADATDVIRVLEAAAESSREGRVVRLE